jgi:hypothetical protein
MTAPHAPAALRSGAWLRRKILPNLNGNMNDCGFFGCKNTNYSFKNLQGSGKFCNFGAKMPLDIE